MGLIALVGGNEFRANCDSMDRLLLDATGAERPGVAIIPTAAAEQNPSMAAANGVSHFDRLGADAWPLMVLTSGDAGDPKNVSRLDDADLVYLTGGDPGHLVCADRDLCGLLHDYSGLSQLRRTRWFL